LQENFGKEITFTSNLQDVPDHAILVNPFFNFLQPPLKLKRVCRRQIAVVHDIITLKYPEQFPTGIRGKLYKHVNKLALRRYDSIITDSETSKKDLIQLLGKNEKHIHVVYPVLSNNFYEKKPVKPPIQLPEKYLIYVGDVTWNKNVANIARAIKIAQIPCIFVGKSFATYMAKNPHEITHPEQQEVRAFVEEAKDNPLFIIPGFISDEELIYLYQHAFANLLVSRDEGFGYSYFEAGALGTPSVLANRPIFKETAEETALFADPEDPAEIAEKIKRYIDDSSLQKTLGSATQERSKKFNSDIFRKTFLDAVENNEYYEI
jgi:glycosyltransferase involved in cell wall biosynthesis